MTVRAAHAQPAAAPSTETAERAPNPTAGSDPRPADRSSPARKATLTAEQLTLFSDLVREPEARVERHLAAHPGLLGLAAEAADARARREPIGRSLTATGWIVVGVGLTVGLLTAMAANLPGQEAKREHMEKVAGIEALVGSGVGLALAIPGMVILDHQTSSEKLAAKKYWDARPTTHGLSTPSSARQ